MYVKGDQFVLELTLRFTVYGLGLGGMVYCLRLVNVVKPHTVYGVRLWK